MVAINKILLSECTGEQCGGGTRNPPREARLHARSPVHFLLSPFCRRSRPARDPIGYRGGINLYDYVNSSPVGNVDWDGRSFWSVVGNFAEGVLVGAAVATVVVVLAPEVAAAGAAALVVAGVDAATATTVSSAVVTGGLAVAAGVSTGLAILKATRDIKCHRWNQLAYTAGAAAGGLAVGVPGGGRALAGLSGEPSSVPRPLNPFADWSMRFRLNYPGGSFIKALGKAPTPQAGAGLTGFLPPGLPRPINIGPRSACGCN
jgi:hypothetical protein